MVQTQIAPHVIRNLYIPLFEPENPVHIQLAEACLIGHIALAEGGEYKYDKQQRYIDQLICKILPISESELLALRDSVSALKPSL